MEQKDLDRLNDWELIERKSNLAYQLKEMEERNEHLLKILADMSKMSVERLKKVFGYEK